MTETSEEDHAMAMYLQMLYDEEDQAQSNQELKPPSENVSLVDNFWELNDPNPNIHELFLQFDHEFFWNKLQSVSLRWSSRMTLCAGLCCYEGRGGLCSISLSQPLLKLRPRRDLVETLLHEMIHAYLFVTHNNKDHNDHGPEFHKHMYRINRVAGTKITVYHNFHDEVDSYRQHWWRCTGPCRSQRPFFGFVKRAMNRAPGPNDSWWAEHRAKCHGTFEKIREPENYKSRKNGATLNNSLPKKKTTEAVKNDIRKHLSSPNGQQTSKLPQNFLNKIPKRPTSSLADSANPRKKSKILQGSPGPSKPNPSSHIRTLNSLWNTPPASSTSTSSAFVAFSGKGNVLGSSNRNIIKLGSRSVAAKKKNPLSNLRIDEIFAKVPSSSGSRPPVSSSSSSRISRVIEILDSDTESQTTTTRNTSDDTSVTCPVCGSDDIPANTINQHLDTCLLLKC